MITKSANNLKHHPIAESHDPTAQGSTMNQNSRIFRSDEVSGPNEDFLRSTFRRESRYP